MTKPSLPELLHAAVTAVGGSERPGQVTMAEAVAEAIDDGSHLLVQAGTGTGKSLGYLVPALAHGERVVVATATLALQRQLVERDLPRTVDALHPPAAPPPPVRDAQGQVELPVPAPPPRGHAPGRGGGPLRPVRGGRPHQQAGPGPPTAARLDGRDRDRRPGRPDTRSVRPRVGAGVGVLPECLGAQKCAYGAECFAEMARERAKLAEVVVTNHALLAIDAIEGAPSSRSTRC